MAHDVDCTKLKGRFYDLCTGEGHDQRPDPTPRAVERFWSSLRGKSLHLPVGDLTKVPPEAIVAARGLPGREFKALLDELGLRLAGCEGCKGTMSRMNQAGTAGCKAKRDVFLAEIKSRAKSVDFQKTLSAAWTAVKTGLCWSINPLDPIASLYDLAVSRAEKQDASQTPSG